MRHARTTLAALHSTLAQHRTARREHLRLKRELAAYDTPSARADLDATLARYTPEQSEPVRRLLGQA